MTFGLAHLRLEGSPAHPEDVYIHCGCDKCDERFRKQALAYYTWMRDAGYNLNPYINDIWFPEELK